MMVGKYIRFEMTFDGQDQEVGLLTGLLEMGNEIGFEEEDIEELISPFNNSLAVPPYHKFKSNPEYFHGAYFTKEGYLRFQEAINKIIAAVKYHKSGWEVKVIHISDFLQDELFYEDADQVIAKTYITNDLEEVF